MNVFAATKPHEPCRCEHAFSRCAGWQLRGTCSTATTQRYGQAPARCRLWVAGCWVEQAGVYTGCVLLGMRPPQTQPAWVFPSIKPAAGCWGCSRHQLSLGVVSLSIKPACICPVIAHSLVRLDAHLACLPADWASLAAALHNSVAASCAAADVPTRHEHMSLVCSQADHTQRALVVLT